jgi:hypothetical protein
MFDLLFWLFGWKSKSQKFHMSNSGFFSLARYLFEKSHLPSLLSQVSRHMMSK